MDSPYIHKIIAAALAEDIGRGDITTNALVPAGRTGAGRIVVKAPGIACGLAIAAEVFHQINPKVRFKALVRDGQAVKAGEVIARLKGPVRALLSGERVALNFLSHLSGIATTTQAFVQAVKPYKTAILDTRKTTPLLRQLERYAVRCGGGRNHRFNLEDMAMVKDNHLAFAGHQADLSEIVETIKARKPVKVVLEADSLAQAADGLKSRADVIL